MEYSINELSFDPIAKAINKISRQVISDFISLLHTVCTYNNKACFLVKDAFFYDYGINKWLNDPSIKQEHRQFLLVALGKRVHCIRSDDYSGLDFLVTVDNRQQSAFGCLVAYELEMPTISIQTNDVWANREIAGVHNEIDVCTEMVNEAEVRISNVANVSHLDGLQEIERCHFAQSISSAQDLWEMRGTLFSHLIFCNSVKDQLYDDGDKVHLKQIMKRLEALNAYFKSYDGVYNSGNLGFRAHGESESVKNNPALKNLRLFIKPDGKAEYFFDHIRFSGKYSGSRIYFLPCNTQRKCYVGYIGRHLPI
jgi:hypothetical protein